MKLEFSKSEIILLREMIKARNQFNHINVTRLEPENPLYEKHQDHFKKETELLSSISKKIEGNECQLNRCESDLVATVLVFDNANNDILICETCAFALEIKERETLPENSGNKLLLFYQDKKF